MTSGPRPSNGVAAPPPRRAAGGVRFFLRIAVSVGLLAVLFREISPADVARIFRSARPDLVLLSVALFAASLIGSTYQWWLFLRALGIRLPFAKALDFYVVGIFFNSFTPASLGGDVVKVIDVKRSGGTRAGAAAATLMDRAMGLLVLALAGVGAAWSLGPDSPFPEMPVPLVLSTVALLAGFALLLSRRLLGFVARVVARIPFRPVEGVASRLIGQFALFREDRRIFLVAFGVSVVVQGMRIAVHYLAAEAIGVHISPIYFVLIVPAIAVAISLPISVGGFGVREALGVVLFGRVGVGEAEAFGFELLSHLVAVLVSAWGGVLFALRGRSPLAAPPAAPPDATRARP